MRLLIIAVLLAAIMGAAYVLLAPVGPHTETFVEIAPGTSSSQIAAQLQAGGIVRSQYAFDAVRVVKGGTLKAGEYRFNHPAPVSEIYERMRRGDVYTRSVTIPEGSNIFEIAARIEGAELGSGADFLTAAKKNAQLIADIDPRAQSLEGYLFPDTYRFARHTTPLEMQTAMVKRFRQEASSLSLHGNAHRVVTLASLIEKETPIAAERPLVASVFENRLARDMPLMTDPSVIYAAMLAGKYRGTIYQSDLATDSAYNTYKHGGLPPGPVCSPGVASLKAAMSPALTHYLYFVAAGADPSGHSRFATTLEEHTQNVLAYRRSLHAAGGR